MTEECQTLRKKLNKFEKSNIALQAVKVILDEHEKDSHISAEEVIDMQESKMICESFPEIKIASFQLMQLSPIGSKSSRQLLDIVIGKETYTGKNFKELEAMFPREMGAIVTYSSKTSTKAKISKAITSKCRGK